MFINIFLVFFKSLIYYETSEAYHTKNIYYENVFSFIINVAIPKVSRVENLPSLEFGCKLEMIVMMFPGCCTCC